MNALDLISSCLNPKGKDRPNADKSGEFLLFKRSGPVNGLQIQHREKHNHHGDTFVTLRTITTEPPAHIKELLIRSGSGTDHEDGARLVLYTQNRHWLLNNPGERIRIVDARGVVLATFDIPGQTCNPLPKAAAAVLVPSTPVAASFGQVQ